MKRIFSVIIVLSMLTFTACGVKDSVTKDADTSSPTTSEREIVNEEDKSETNNNIDSSSEGSVSKVGESIFLGVYEQDNNLKNGKEAIEWVIQEETEKGYLLVSRYVLDFKNFHNVEELVSWETSDIRAWLNGEFYEESFNDEEKTKILLTTVDNSEDPTLEQKDKPYPNYSTYGYDHGNDTEDYVYLLSEYEYYKMYEGSESMDTFATSYAYAIGVASNINNNQINPETGRCSCLTRTRTDNATCIANGNNGADGIFVLLRDRARGVYDHWRQPFGVQPVMWISK